MVWWLIAGIMFIITGIVWCCIIVGGNSDNKED